MAHNWDKHIQRLQDDHEEVFWCVLEGSLKLRYSPLFKDIISQFQDCGIDMFFYESIKKDVLKGNFDVLYLDDRMVGEDKKRIKLQKYMNKVRAHCNKRKNAGDSAYRIVFGEC